MLATLRNRPALRVVRNPLTTRIAAETLEDRIVLAAAVAAPVVGEALGTIESITVESLEVVDGQLIATATVVGNLLGRPFELPVEIPIDVGTTDAGGECPILNLSLGPVNLDLLGLNVVLDDCEGGPVTVDITAIEGPGNLLGNLLCDVATLLDGGLALDELTDEQLAGITEALNQILDGILNPPEAEGIAAQQVGGSTTDLLDLEIPGGVHLDLLGLAVDTSGICLHVFAESGSGNLLGNLLGSIAHLLDRNPGNAINAKLDQIERVLAGLLDDDEELLRGRGR